MLVKLAGKHKNPQSLTSIGHHARKGALIGGATAGLLGAGATLGLLLAAKKLGHTDPALLELATPKNIALATGAAGVSTGLLGATAGGATGAGIGVLRHNGAKHRTIKE